MSHQTHTPELLPLSILEDLTAPLLAERERQEAERQAERERRQYRPIDPDDSRAGRYVSRALESAYNKVAYATTDRTNIAYGQAFRLGRLLAYWPLAESDVINTLADASRANGAEAKYRADEMLRHIHNGIADGMANPEPLELPTFDRQGRAIDLDALPDEDDYADTLRDARDFWDDLPDIAPGRPADDDLDIEPIERPTTRYADYADGPLWGELQWAWVLPGAFRQILYTAIDAGLYRGFTADELEQAAADLGLTTSARSVGELHRQHGLLQVLETDQEYIGLSTKSVKNPGGRPILRFALPDRDELHRLIKQYGYGRLLTLAMTDGRDVLPMYAREQLLSALGIEIPNEDDLIAALDSIIEGLKARDPDFKRQIDRAWGRFRHWYDQLCHDLDCSDIAEDFAIDPDLHHADTAKTVFAAQMARIQRDQRAGDDISRHEWCMLTGVSNGSLKKVLTLSGTRRVGGKPPTKTAKLDANNPFDVPRAAQELHEEIGGRPRYIIADSRRLPYNGANLQAVVMDCEAVYIEYSVAGPWEQFTPTAEEIALSKEPAQSRPALDHTDDLGDDTPRKPRRPHYEGPNVDPNIARAWFDNLLESTGWRRDEGEYWSDPARVLWPDHVPTLMQALTGVQIPGARGPIDEDETMLNIHHTAEKYDEQPPDDIGPEPDTMQNPAISAPAQEAIATNGPQWFIDWINRPSIFGRKGIA